MSGYIGQLPVPQATQTRQSFVAALGQTTFNTLGYQPGFLDVYLNGVKLIEGTDFTATNGSDIVLSVGASLDDVVDFLAFSTFEIASYSGDLPVGGDLTVSGDVTIEGDLTTDGDNTIDGDLIVNANATVGGDATIEGSLTVDGGFTSMGIDDNATSTAMTLDSSGNLLVGKTSSAATISGCELRPSGRASFTATDDFPLQLRRYSSDGEIMQFRKDGTTVGSIGTQSGTLQIDGASGSTGLLFGASNLYPRDNGANSDGGVDIGGSSIRFKDLYLSGGVYLGGTGSANHLDDYEEGTWTPVIKSDTDPIGYTVSSSASPSYTKTGNLVSVGVGVTRDSTDILTNVIRISNLPYAIAYSEFDGAFWINNGGSNHTGGCYVYQPSSDVLLRQDGNSTYMIASDWSDGRGLYFRFTYRTNS